MVAEKLAKEIGYYVDGNKIMNKHGHLAPQYSGKGTTLFSFRSEGVIYTARLDLLKSLYAEKSQNLLSSARKQRRDELVYEEYLKTKSYAQTCRNLEISKGSLHKIIKRKLTINKSI